MMLQPHQRALCGILRALEDEPHGERAVSAREELLQSAKQSEQVLEDNFLQMQARLYCEGAQREYGAQTKGHPFAGLDRLVEKCRFIAGYLSATAAMAIHARRLLSKRPFLWLDFAHNTESLLASLLTGRGFLKSESANSNVAPREEAAHAASWLVEKHPQRVTAHLWRAAFSAPHQKGSGDKSAETMEAWMGGIFSNSCLPFPWLRDASCGILLAQLTESCVKAIDEAIIAKIVSACSAQKWTWPLFVAARYRALQVPVAWERSERLLRQAIELAESQRHQWQSQLSFLRLALIEALLHVEPYEQHLETAGEMLQELREIHSEESHLALASSRDALSALHMHRSGNANAASATLEKIVQGGCSGHERFPDRLANPRTLDILVGIISDRCSFPKISVTICEDESISAISVFKAGLALCRGESREGYKMP